MRKPWTEQTISSTSRSELDDGTPLTGDRKRLVYETSIGAGDFLMGRLKGHSQRITGSYRHRLSDITVLPTGQCRVKEMGRKEWGPVQICAGTGKKLRTGSKTTI